MGHSKGYVPSLTTIEELAKHYIGEIQALQPKGPYFLIGHSFGGLVAYEMAQQLLVKGEQIGFIALFDTYTKWGEKLPMKKRLINIFSFPRKSLKIIIVTIQKKLQNILKSIKKIMDKSVYHPNLSIKSLVQAYTLKTYSGQIHFFKAMNSFSISSKLELPEVNLQKFVMGNLEIHEIPGNHHSIVQEPHVKVLAEKLAFHLGKSLTD
jgi:thioesterase domain-containing protein